MASKNSPQCVRTHICEANATCPVCRTVFTPHRRWQTFCCDKCRRVAWRDRHRTGVYTDVRDSIQEILAILREMKGETK
jgi:hypothetical protein